MRPAGGPAPRSWLQRPISAHAAHRHPCSRSRQEPGGPPTQDPTEDGHRPSLGAPGGPGSRQGRQTAPGFTARPAAPSSVDRAVSSRRNQPSSARPLLHPDPDGGRMPARVRTSCSGQPGLRTLPCRPSGTAQCGVGSLQATGSRGVPAPHVQPLHPQLEPSEWALCVRSAQPLGDGTQRGHEGPWAAGLSRRGSSGARPGLGAGGDAWSLELASVCPVALSPSQGSVRSHVSKSAAGREREPL